MSTSFPYTYISCPCSDSSRKVRTGIRGSRTSISPTREDDDQDEKTFNPRHPRSKYSLIPPEHLLYCEECHDIKCPRCITEEIVCWYCPSCLFETPSSLVRSEGNRCARNCFNCPICTASLTVNSIGDGTAKDGPWILNCNYCMWTALDIGIKFEKPTNVRSQLEKIANGGLPKASNADAIEEARKSSLARDLLNLSDTNKSDPDLPDEDMLDDPVARFAALKAFYKQQLAASSGNDPLNPSSYDPYSSPSALTRIMNLYTSSSSGIRKPKQKTPLMREALTLAEGLSVVYVLLKPNDPSPSPNSKAFHPRPPPDLTQIPTPTQLQCQHPSNAGGNPTARLTSNLRPLPTLLRTKRSKRCQECKHILVKPEFKPQSTRFRIRLVALAYIPLVSLRRLNPTPPTMAEAAPAPKGQHILQPGKTNQFILTLKNHLFDPVKVSLGVPGTTTGKYGHKVTVLCPVFEIGAHVDVWDDALGSDAASSTTTGISAVAGGEGATAGPVGGMGSGTMEAGKVYERGRNWVGVGVEVVCVPTEKMPRIPGAGNAEEDDSDEEDEDQDILEIPIRVRLEWRQSDADAEAADDAGGKKSSEAGAVRKQGTMTDGAAEQGQDEDPARRELAYWMVVGVGRVGRLGG